MDKARMIDISNKKILLVRNDNVGDLICTTPAIEALRKKYKDNQIDIVVNSYNFDAIYNNPFINKIYCYTKPKHKSGFFNKLNAGLGKLKILFDIYREKYDVVIVFRSSYSKSAELFANITNAKYKVGIENKKGKDNFNIHVISNDSRHEVEFCMDCLKEFDVSYDSEKTYYFIDNELQKKYKDYKEHILFHISSRIEENKFSKDKFKELFDLIEDKKILISAEPMDFETAQWLEKNTKAKFVKTSSLTDLGALIKNVSLFITLDGGAMHLAPAVGTKTIAISGKTNMKKWYPWGYEDLVVQDSSRIANKIDVNIILSMAN